MGLTRLTPCALTRRRLQCLAAIVFNVLVLCAASQVEAAPVAERRFKFTKDFKRSFEAALPGKHAYGVLVAAGVPATSYYGAVRTFTKLSGTWSSKGGLFYPIAIVDGRIVDMVPEKGGFRKLSRKDFLTQTLRVGELMRITDIDYTSKGLRIEALTVKFYRVERGKDAKTGEPIVFDEPFAVEFLFVPTLDRAELTATEIQSVISYVEKTMKLFADMGKAVDFALARTAKRKKPAKEPRKP